MKLTRKCFRCIRPAVKRGLCEVHLQTPQYRPRGFKKPRKRTERKRPYILQNDKRWYALSAKWKQENEWCVRCLKRPAHKGGPRKVAVVHTDHIFPAHKYLDRIYDESNLQSLCRICHAVKSAYERSGIYYDYARGIKYEELPERG